MENSFYQKKIEKLNQKNKIIKQSDSEWKESFKKLKTYLNEKQGIYPSSKSQDQEEKYLEMWIRVQNSFFKEGLLAPWKISELKSINFEFKDKLNYWDAKFEKVENFLNLHKMFPSVYSQDKEENELAKWLNKQKDKADENKLQDAKLKKLISIGAIRPNNEKSCASWDETFLTLEVFVTNRCRFPELNFDDLQEKSLYEWVARQKILFTENRLDRDKEIKLENLGIEWNENEKIWDNNLEKLIDFIQDNGRYPRQTIVEEKSLATWFFNQKKKIKTNDVKPRRLKKLYDSKVLNFNEDSISKNENELILK